MDLPKGLPQPVADRITDLSGEGMVARQRGELVEARLSRPEVRMVGDDRAEIHGYATVYEYPYDVFGGPSKGGFTETIAAGATKKSVKERDDVRLLRNHDGIALARTKSGTMTLRSDDTGLLVDATLDLRSTESRDAAIAMERGDLDEMSFAFQAIRQEWDDDYTERRILEVKLYDVSLVTYPANPAASAYLRDADLVPARGLSLSLARAQADALFLHR
jgi:HK97 family phage prohead protease